MSISVFLPSAQVGHFYKVPHGQELPFAGRWLKCTKVWPGAVDFRAAGGNCVRLGRASAECLVKNATDTRVTSPKAFC